MRPLAASIDREVAVRADGFGRARSGRDDRVFVHHASERPASCEASAGTAGLRHARAEAAAPDLVDS